MPNAATWWAQHGRGVVYVRCELPARYLPGKVFAGDLPLDLIQPGETEGSFVFPRNEGAAIWSYPGKSAREVVMNGMMWEGIPTLVEVDDNYLTLPPALPGYQGQWVKDHDRQAIKPSVESHVECANLADWVICSTAKLAEEYRSLHDRVSVCRNSVDPIDWPDLEERDQPFTIGFAGSISHLHDLRLVTRALSWASEQDGVRVVQMGTPREWPFECEHLPWTDDLGAYRASLGVLDVGLCPLHRGRWQDCKSDLKALEYAMAGALPIVSRVEPYRDWWETPLPCLVAQSPSEWLKQVKWCVHNQDEVRALRAEALAYVLSQRTAERVVGDWREAIQQATWMREENMRDLSAA